MEQDINPKVQGTFSGITTVTYTCPKVCNMFSILNKGLADLSFTIGNITITVPFNQSFEDSFEDFTEVTVTATGAFTAIVKGW